PRKPGRRAAEVFVVRVPGDQGSGVGIPGLLRRVTPNDDAAPGPGSGGRRSCRQPLGPAGIRASRTRWRRPAAAFRGTIGDGRRNSHETTAANILAVDPIMNNMSADIGLLVSTFASPNPRA